MVLSFGTRWRRWVYTESFDNVVEQTIHIISFVQLFQVTIKTVSNSLDFVKELALALAKFVIVWRNENFMKIIYYRSKRKKMKVHYTKQGRSNLFFGKI